MTNRTGFLNIIKPTGMTSADVVFAVKKILKTKKVGHLGTLDPAASGVLPIAIGKATKFFDYFLKKDKVYVARVKFGIKTDTLDSYGQIIETDKVKVTKVQIEQILPKFKGKIKQIPPKYSAIKIGGKRACDLARENINFDISAKQIEIFDIKILQDLSENEFLFKVHCSAGTYIRTLFADIAKKLGTFATTPVILRTKSGRFDIKNATALNEITEENIMSISSVFDNLTTIEVGEPIAKKLINGVKISVKELGENTGDEFFISYKNKTIGFYKKEGDDVCPIIYLYEVNDG